MSDRTICRDIFNVAAPATIAAASIGLACLSNSYGETALALASGAPSVIFIALAGYGVYTWGTPATPSNNYNSNNPAVMSLINS